MTENDQPCTLETLDRILTAPTAGMVMEPSDSYDEVYPGILIGEESIAKNYAGLKRLGITHVLNAAMGTDNLYFVRTNEKYYSRTPIKFHGVPAIDHDSFNMTPFFDESVKFIHSALSEKGKILVNCRQGMSRSATLVLAYLMVHQQMRLPHAVRHVRQQREIYPNQGFLLQLIALYNSLQEQNHFVV